MHLMMLHGIALDTAVGIDWEKTMDKDTTWEMEDYREWLLWLSSWLLPEELPLSRYATRGTLTTKQRSGQ
jgi:hypothetical protein